jgi:MOSC domain-containing protein YiiM
MKLNAVCTGKIKSYSWNDKVMASGILKLPIEGKVMVKTHGLVGDEQADLKHHGGYDKAVYGFSVDTYPFWQETLKRDAIQFGEFGENLSIDELDEKKIFVGDTFTVGGCILQAVQPRKPCYKQEIIFKQHLIEKFYEHNRCGVYFRVIQEGYIEEGGTFTLINSEKIKVSIYELFQVYKNKGHIEKSRARELASINSMSSDWKNKFASIQ